MEPEFNIARPLGITLGDPSGIGPEIVTKALFDPRLEKFNFILYGNAENLKSTSSAIEKRLDSLDNIEIVDIPGKGIETGRVCSESGSVALRSIESATRDALHGKTSGICTAPINKEAIMLAGSKFKDHTEMLGNLTGSKDVVTVFETDKLRVIFLSKHVSLREACELVTKERVYRYILLADKSLRALGVQSGRIAVAALNPHSGESGILGSEEIETISPAIEEARKVCDVAGPFPADSVFHRASQGVYDIVLSMYHDQGHIASKMLSFSGTVSMNLGLPFLRTSVDHGTAFDIAGKGIADHTSMTEAILKCAHYSGRYSWD